eukprot:12146-Heterococcus_DN1.PRE.2
MRYIGDLHGITLQCSKQFQIAQQPRAGAHKRCVPIGKQRQLHYASSVALMVLVQSSCCPLCGGVDHIGLSPLCCRL